MTERQEIQLRLACAALQGGMSVEDVLDGMNEWSRVGLWDIMNEIAPDLFPCRDELAKMKERDLQSNTKVVY